MILKEIAMDLPYKKDEKRIKKIQEQVELITLKL